MLATCLACVITDSSPKIRDLQGLYWATRESDIASLIFMSTFLVFVASIVFKIAGLFHISVLEDSLDM